MPTSSTWSSLQPTLSPHPQSSSLCGANTNLKVNLIEVPHISEMECYRFDCQCSREKGTDFCYIICHALNITILFLFSLLTWWGGTGTHRVLHWFHCFCFAHIVLRKGPQHKLSYECAACLFKARWDGTHCSPHLLHACPHIEAEMLGEPCFHPPVETHLPTYFPEGQHH